MVCQNEQCPQLILGKITAVFGGFGKMTWPHTLTRRTRRRQSVSQPVRSAKAMTLPPRTDNGTQKRRRPTPARVPVFGVFLGHVVSTEAWINGATVRPWMRPLPGRFPVQLQWNALLSGGALPLLVRGQAS